MIVVMVVVGRLVDVHMRGGLEAGKGEGEGESHDEGSRESDSIMAMKLELRKEIAGGDAEEHAGGEGERPRRDDADIGRARAHGPRPEESDARGHQKGEEDVGQKPQPRSELSTAHERRERHRIEGLVQDDDQEGRKSGERAAGRRDDHARSERYTLEEAVDAQAEERADPADATGRMRRMVVPAGTCADVGVAGSMVGVGFRLVLVEVEEALEQKEREESTDGEQHERVEKIMSDAGSVPMSVVRCVDAAGFRDRVRPQHDRVRQHVEEAHPEHHPGDEGEEELQAAVTEPEEPREEASGDRDGDDHAGVEDEEGGWRHGGERGSVAGSGNGSGPARGDWPVGISLWGLARGDRPVGIGPWGAPSRGWMWRVGLEHAFGL